MKTHFFKHTTYLGLLALLFGFTSCADELDENLQIAPEATQGIEVDQDEDGHPEHLPDYDFADAIINHVEAHGVDLSDREPVLIERPDGTVEEKYLLEGDIEVSKEEFKALAQSIEAGEKQYRTSNLVSSPQTITVIGYTGGSYALTYPMQVGLQWAIANYNALNTGLNFSLSFSSSTNADIVVYRNFQNSGAGGSAGFPSGGNPYKWVQIYAGMNNYSFNVNEHVVGHEIGHCLGLRHTDYFSRQSCGQNTNEGSAGVGAIHIPGTPTGYDANSLMLACFSSNEDGEFGFYDRVALEYLY
jgi:hypothetical protein